MKKYLCVVISFVLSLSLLFTGCGKSGEKSAESTPAPQAQSAAETPSQNPPSTESTESKLENTPDIKYNTITNYYGMTMNDVIQIWGDDYILNDYLYSGGWAGIYYADNRCPFTFYYRAGDIPTVCDVNEKVAGVGVNKFSDVADYYITEGINIAISYEDVSKQLSGEIYPDEMWGGNTFNCSDIENVKRLTINWGEGKTVPSRLDVSFNYN